MQVFFTSSKQLQALHYACSVSVKATGFILRKYMATGLTPMPSLFKLGGSAAK